MSKLTDFKLLSFDVYGTLIDWERGALTAFEPSLRKSGKTSDDPDFDGKRILQVLHEIEPIVERENPRLKYSEVLSIVHPKLCKELGLEEPTKEESKKFGNSVGDWPGFSDSVEALKRLSTMYKLVVLSNVDNESFKAGNAHGLEGFKFDAVYTAEDIGSYKPDLRNFEYMLKQVKEDFGIEKHEVLQTAQSQFHDHHPAKDIGIKSSWIYRPGAVMGNRKDPVFNWKFDTLSDMADAVEKELADQKK
ncbi:HAD-like protein [Cucurbitaria berberidis CBS 394.84]|uniref:HAD-like protein n=1 Tax=Cucurbitaria berberidis CBS 394.84 TaxID=1168544 RepID=A0A9P4GJW5_9PLEO|nr:HAD-like protein [Cucurbitaria berberidis CBS 394.84]KAF1847633.1 HAD-like protein [Cucurbitaria berberidis CBS 394.84]